MAFTQGVIEQIFLKKLNQPDPFGNVNRVSIQMQGVNGQEGCWFGAGSTKQVTFGQLKIKAGFLTKGTMVEFMYTEKPTATGIFYNVDNKTLKILQAGESPKAEYQSQAPAQEQPPQQAPQTRQQAPAQQSGGKIVRNGQATGAAMNQAVSLHGTRAEIDFNFIEITANHLFEIGARVLAGGVSTQQAPAQRAAQPAQRATPQQAQPTPVQQQVQQPQAPAGADDFFDDDIPF